MPRFEASDIITRLTVAKNSDTTRLAGDPYKLPGGLRADVDADLAQLMARETDTSPAEGARAGASGAKRAALDELERQHRGGYRGIAAIDEDSITAGARLQVFESYGWPQGEIGDFDDARTIALARLAPTVSAAEVGGEATRLYTAARLARIAAQLALIDALESTASGADRQFATLRRDTALALAAGTLLRVRFFYCSATRDGEATPELVRIGYQPRRDPGEVGGGGETGGGGTPPPAPTPLEIATLVADDPVTVTVTYVTGGGVGADELHLQYKLPGEADFGHDNLVVLPSQQIVDSAFTGALVVFRTLLTNATGTTTSGEQSLQF